MRSAGRRRSACAAGSPSCGRSAARQAGRSPRSRRAGRGTRPEEHLRVLAIGKRAEAGIASERRRRPLPDGAGRVFEPPPGLRGLLPLGLGRQALAGPAGVSLRLVERDVLDGRRVRLGEVSGRRPPSAVELSRTAAFVTSRAVDPERWQLDLVRRPLVVVCARSVDPSVNGPASTRTSPLALTCGSVGGRSPASAIVCAIVSPCCSSCWTTMPTRKSSSSSGSRASTCSRTRGQRRPGFDGRKDWQRAPLAAWVLEGLVQVVPPRSPPSSQSCSK